MKIVILDAKTLGDVNLDIFKKFGTIERYETTSQESLQERIKDADIVITNKVIFGDKQMKMAPNLKLICVAATGVNNIDLNAANTHKIVVKNVAGYSTNSVVQQTFASLLFLLNKCKFYDEFTSSGGWIKSDIFTNVSQNISEIYGKRFGIIGLGEIGKGVAKIAKAFGCEVVYFSTSGAHNDDEFKRVELEELLKTSNIISIHAALNEKTKNLLTKSNLSMMKDGAILMNFGRGGIVNEADLAKILDEKEIFFTTDVLENEPMKQDNPLGKIKHKERIFITPHIAWASSEARNRLVEKIAQNIENFLKDSNGK